MIINSIKLKNFRNYESLEAEFSEDINIFYGDNAQGKTNILEAIFLSATTKSHRGSKEREMIRLGEDEAHIRLNMCRKKMEHKIDMHLKKNSPKGAAIDGLKIRKSSELYGLLHVISFSPEDLQLVKNGPSERRRFMDMELCQLDKIYISNLSSYNKALMQRNNLLKQLGFNRELLGTLDIWDEQLVRFGSEIIKTRKKFIEELNETAAAKHYKLSSGKENLRLEYKPYAEAENFEKKLKESLERDLNLKQTNVGPHKDDINFYINENNVRNYGSQGQIRSVALSLKLSEIELVKRKINDTPVLLLDDVLSELDRSRQLSLFSETEGVQTFITCTGLEEFIEKQRKDNKVFHVVSGSVS